MSLFSLYWLFLHHQSFKGTRKDLGGAKPLFAIPQKCLCCHHSHYAHQNFNTLSSIIIPENFPIIPRYSENLPDYSGIFSDSFLHLLYSKLCWHNRLMPKPVLTMVLYKAAFKVKQQKNCNFLDLPVKKSKAYKPSLYDDEVGWSPNLCSKF